MQKADSCAEANILKVLKTIDAIFAIESLNMHYKNICHAAGKSYRESFFLCVLSALVFSRVSVLSGCFLLQGGWRSSEQDFHRQSQGRAHPGACQNQYIFVSAVVTRVFFSDRCNDLSDLGFRHLYVLLSVTAISVKWWTTSFRCSETRKQTFPPRTPLASATTGAINSQMVPSRKQRSLSS